MTGPAPAATLVFGWGNPSRGDDALGPLAVAEVERWQLPGVDCLVDYQLQVEHALDLAGRSRVLFVDACQDGSGPFWVSDLEPALDASYTTHEMSPQAVLQVCRQVLGAELPATWLLGIRGETWGLGEPPSAAAQSNLRAALAWLRGWLSPS